MRTTLSTTRSTRVAALASGAVLMLVLSACGSDDSTVAGPPASSSSSGAAGAVDEQHNDADITFVKDMKPHHDGALAMAELAPDRASSAEVKDLAARIAAAQGPEIEQLKAFASAWEVDLGDGGGHSGMSMGGMAMGQDAETLEPLSGAEFDRTFLELMIAHHEGALPMAQVELADGANAQAKQMAQDIVAAQTAEIAEMKALVAQL